MIIKWAGYQIEHFPEKSIFITLKAKPSSKFVYCDKPMKLAGSTQYPTKYRNTKSTKQNKNLPKKVNLVP
jgi:hypothetical protein